MDAMFVDYETHLVTDEARSTISKSDWSYINEYIRWFFRVSHPYMVWAALGDPLRPAHQELLEEEKAQLDHVEDVLPRYHCIVEIAHACIDRGIFLDGSDVRQILDVIMTEARETLMYQRQCQRMGVLKVEEP